LPFFVTHAPIRLAAEPGAIHFFDAASGEPLA
jgi:hypothetical protein